MKNRDREARWGWKIAMEMFFIGSASGAFIIIVLLRVIASADVPARSVWIPLILSLIGVFFLFKELGHPGRAWQFIFNLRSTISVGALITSSFILVMGILVLRHWRSVTETFLVGLATLLAVGLVIYPGILIAEVRGRASTLSIHAPILFLASSLSTGAAWLILEGATMGTFIQITTTFPILNLISFSFVLTQLVILASWGMVGRRLEEQKWQEVQRMYEQGKWILILMGIGLVLPSLSILVVNQAVFVMSIQSCLILMSGVALRFLLLLRDPEIDLKEIRYLSQMLSG